MISAVLIIFLFIGWSIVSFFLAFLVGQKFYLQLANVISVSLVVFIVLWVFRFVSVKVTNIILVSCLIICTVVISVYEFNRNSRDSLATVNEQGVNLYDYQPFHEHTKTVSLDKPSTLKIKSGLPKLDGATALYPLYAAFAQATYPEKEYQIQSSEVMCTTTVDAYTNLIEGNADIIFAAAPSQKQLEAAKSKGIELKLTPIGREAFVFFVNSNNRVNGLSSHQLQGIYSGGISNWSEVGGNNDRIRAFQDRKTVGAKQCCRK
jgi:phosphate transport system substrate-binding protein